MVARNIALFLIAFWGISASAALAQSEARLRVVMPTIEQVENNLQWLIELSPTPELKKQWKKLKESVLDALLEGVDLTKPAEVDVVFQKEEIELEFFVPVADLKGFANSVAGMGFAFKTQIKQMAAGVQTTFAEKGKKPYRFKENQGYVTISPDQRPAPANPQFPAIIAAHPGKQLFAELKNGAAGLEARRENFKEFRKQIEATVKLRRNEEKNAFELRKTTVTHNLEEAERFVVESEEIQLSLNLTSSQPTPNVRGELVMSALPGTELLKTIQQFAVKPSYFANVTLHPNPVFEGKMAFPLDELRVQHLAEFFKLVRPALELEIDNRPSKTESEKGKTPEEKTVMKQAANIFLDMLEAASKLAIIDGFIDAHTAESGTNMIVAGIRVADGKVADQILKLLPGIDAGWAVKPGEEHGGVAIHEITIPPSRVDSFQKIFAGETVALVGTSKDVVWLAAGNGSIALLKSAIDEVAKPAPEKAVPEVVTFQIQVAKLIPLLEIMQKEAPKLSAPKGKEQVKTQKDVEKHRKLAADTMGGCNSMLHGELKRTGDKIEGFFEMNECLLKYVGAVFADTIKDTLE